jgi:hypothetical protein
LNPADKRKFEKEKMKLLTKALLNAKNAAFFICPSCKKRYRRDLSNRKDIRQGSKLNCRCTCGAEFSIILERRRHNRKPTELNGAYLHERHRYRGGILVKNLSRSGAGIEILSERQIYEGDTLTLKFNLDDDQKTFVAKEAVIRKKKGTYVGVEFLSKTWDNDPLFAYLKQRA